MFRSAGWNGLKKAALVLVVGVGLALALPAWAYEPDSGGGIDLDFRFGAFVPGGDWDSGFGGGVWADLGEVWNGVHVLPGAYLYRAELSESFAGIDLDVSVTSLSIGSDLRYYLGLEPRGLYFGAGGYLHLVDGDFAGESFSEADPSFSGFVGYRFGDSGFRVEARHSVVSGFDHSQLLVGYGF